MQEKNHQQNVYFFERLAHRILLFTGLSYICFDEFSFFFLTWEEKIMIDKMTKINTVTQV